MSATFARLKLAILLSGFRGEAKRSFGVIIAIVMSLIGGITGFVRFSGGAHKGGQSPLHGVVIGFTMLFSVWVFGPLLLGGVDDSLDPRTLMLLPLPRRQLRRGLLIAGLIGFLPFATTLALAGVVVGYGPFAIVPVLALLLLCVGASRLLATMLARAIRSRRGRDLAVIIAALAGSVLWLGSQSARRLHGHQLDVLVGVLRWTPSGALGQAVFDSQQGRYMAAMARTAAGLLCAAIALWAWWSALEKLLVHSESVRAAVRIRGEGRPLDDPRAMLAGRSNSRSAVVLAKELIYVRRSPQRRSALVIGTVIGTLFALFQIVKTRHPGVDAVFAAPIGLIFGLGVTNNLLGAEGPALWLELLSGATFRDLLVGRGLAAVPNLLLPQIFSALLLGTLSGAWPNTAYVILLSMVTWGVPLGVGTAISVLTPFPQPETANPFSNRRVAPGEGCLIGLMGLGGLAAVSALLAPIMYIVWTTRTASVATHVGVAAAAAAWSFLVWTGALSFASWFTQGKEPALLEALGAHQVNT